MTQNTDPRTEPVARELKDETPLSPMRTTIADRLQNSYRDAAHVTLTREASLPPVEPGLALIADETTAPSIVDVLLGAVSEALNTHPAFNATYDAAEKTHRTYHEHNVGIATDVDDGLVVPVLRDLRDDSIIDIHRQRTAVVDRVQRGSFSMSRTRDVHRVESRPTWRRYVYTDHQSAPSGDSRRRTPSQRVRSATGARRHVPLTDRT